MDARRRKILCLGMSCVDAKQVHGAVLGGAAVTESLQVAVDCVERGILTQMDCRDLARCIAMEKECQVDVCCVSQEEAAVCRADRHCEGNFNRSTFAMRMDRHFGRCQFDQITLDYFWAPAGWNEAHWKRSFFQETLVRFAADGLIAPALSRNGDTPSGLRRATILPFCFHCLREVVVGFHKLRVCYNAAFVRKHELGGIALWTGTQSIDPDCMQAVLGKQTDQEEICCTSDLRSLEQCVEDDRTKVKLSRVVEQLKDPGNVQFVVLEPLAQCNIKEGRVGCHIGLGLWRQL